MKVDSVEALCLIVLLVEIAKEVLHTFVDLMGHYNFEVHHNFEMGNFQVVASEGRHKIVEAAVDLVDPHTLIVVDMNFEVLHTMIAVFEELQMTVEAAVDL
jgi:hypothetical protein